jgi:hypothetical protein
VGKLSRNKGNRFMREIAKALREGPFVGMDIHKGDQGRKGSDAADVDAPGLPIWTECKFGATVGYSNPFRALEQAARDSNGRPPVAFCKVGSNKADSAKHATIMAVPLEFGLELLRAWQETRTKNDTVSGNTVNVPPVINS